MYLPTKRNTNKHINKLKGGEILEYFIERVNNSTFRMKMVNDWSNFFDTDLYLFTEIREDLRTEETERNLEITEKGVSYIR